jgi:hypothetical protein
MSLQKSGTGPRLGSIGAHRSITLEEAERAIYIDFEMRVKDPPALIGVLMEGAFDQVILAPGLMKAVGRGKTTFYSLLEVVEGLYRLCLEEERQLVAYSQHERNVIHHFTGLDVGPIYRDARMIAVDWRKTFHPNWRTKSNKLKTFLRQINYLRAEDVEDTEPAAWIDQVTKGLKRAGKFSELTDKQKAAWKRLLDYNWNDCDGMRELTLRAARESA